MQLLAQSSGEGLWWQHFEQGLQLVCGTHLTPNQAFLELSPVSVHFWHSGNHSHTHKASQCNRAESWTHETMKISTIIRWSLVSLLILCSPHHSKQNLPQKQRSTKKSFGTITAQTRTPPVAHRDTFIAFPKRVTWLFVMDEPDIQPGKELILPFWEGSLKTPWWRIPGSDPVKLCPCGKSAVWSSHSYKCWCLDLNFQACKNT